MLSIQSRKLLSLRGIKAGGPKTLGEGVTYESLIAESGGDPTVGELEKVNDYCIKLYMSKYKTSVAEVKTITEEKVKIKDDYFEIEEKLKVINEDGNEYKAKLKSANEEMNKLRSTLQEKDTLLDNTLKDVLEFKEYEKTLTSTIEGQTDILNSIKDQISGWN